MKFTFNSESYGTTVEINFEATTLDEIRDMFDQFLRGSGFYFEDEDDVYTSEERVQKTDKSIHEPWDTSDMAYRAGGLTVEQAEKQEPVAWQNLHLPDEFYDHKLLDPSWYSNYRPLYTTLPKREWVGLTEDEVHEAAIKCVTSGQSVNAAIRAIEAKLKERNT
jgi:hypothetical protein